MENVKFVELSELIDQKKGKKVKSSKIKTPGSIPYLLIDTLRGEDPIFFTEDKKYTEAIPEDILIVGDGANSGLVGTGLKGAVGSTIIRLRKKVNDIDTKYITHFLNLYFEKFKTDVKGSGTPHLKVNEMMKMKIRKPSLKEQNHIVELIESNLSKNEEIKKMLSSGLIRSEKLRKSILKSAFEGKLSKNE